MKTDLKMLSGYCQVLTVRKLAFLLALLVSVVLNLGAAPAHGIIDFTAQVRILKPGDPVHDHINASSTHTYELTVPAQQAVQVIVEQNGVDVHVRVIAPDDSVYVDMDSPNGNNGREKVSIVSSSGGTYKVLVQTDASVAAGDYELRLDGPRPSTSADEQRVIAEHMFAEAQALRGGAAKLPWDQAKEN